MKLKPKPTYFTRQDLQLILEFDKLLEIRLESILMKIKLQQALEISKKMQKTLDFATFFADFKAKYKNGKWELS